MAQIIKKTAIIAICQTPTLAKKSQALEEVEKMFLVHLNPLQSYD